MKIEGGIITGLILASVLGLFGQDIAYLLNDHVYQSYPVYFLIGCTILSILIYVITAVIAWVARKRNKLTTDKGSIYLALIGLIGLSISCWSLFVLAMWMG